MHLELRNAMFYLGVIPALLTPARAPLAADDLFVATSNFEISGNTTVIGLEPPYTPAKDLLPIHGDAVVRRWNNYVFVVNRLGADNITVLDASDDYRLVSQYSTGPSSNPQDIAVIDEDKAYISLYSSDDLLIVNPLDGTEKGSIDLSDWADADGLPEAQSMLLHQGRVFVALQRWDRLYQPWTLTSSCIAVVDTATDSVVDADPEVPGVDPIWLTAQNPNDELRYSTELDRILVNCSGEWTLLDGGVEMIDPTALTSTGLLLEEIGLGADVAGIAVSSSAGYVLTSDLYFNMCLKQFSLATGAITGTVRCASGFSLTDVEVTGDRGYLADRSSANAGVWVFDANTGGLLTAAPVCTGLPPFDLSVPVPVKTSVPPQVQLRWQAYPNPFNPRVTLMLEGIGDTRAPDVRIHDARGRLVAVLRGSSQGAKAAYSWDGTDLDGNAVASGTYRAAVDSPGIPALPLTLAR